MENVISDVLNSRTRWFAFYFGLMSLLKIWASLYSPATSKYISKQCSLAFAKQPVKKKESSKLEPVLIPLELALWHALILLEDYTNTYESK